MTISNPSLPLKQKLICICQTIKKEIKQSDRVSLWVFKEDYSEIFKIGGFDENNQYVLGDILKRSEYPQYFDHILTYETLTANKARTHPATTCFNSTYFKEKEVFSLLDFIYHYDFKPTGIICCEAVNSEIEWEPKCIEKLKRIANISSIFFSKNINDTKGGKEALLNITDSKMP